MPVLEMDLQLALVGQPSSSELGSQMRAHMVGVDEPEVSRTHSGRAVVPAGTSLVQVLVTTRFSHLGEQKEPEIPSIWMASSSDMQEPELGSP